MGNPHQWRLFRGDHKSSDRLHQLPPPPPWRPSSGSVDESQERRRPTDDNDCREFLSRDSQECGRRFEAETVVIQMVNAALYLRRPLLVTGEPGSGKSSLIDAVAYELRMGEPLRWPVGSQSTLRDALYHYDAIGRLKDAQTPGLTEMDPGRYVKLGPLGTALLPTRYPRALLIDEIDKADIDLPNDLLNVFERGEFEVPELSRLGNADLLSGHAAHVNRVNTSDPLQPIVAIKGGRIKSVQFPLMILTSNGEREFPAPFLRRCLRLDMPNPTDPREAQASPAWGLLDRIVSQYFDENDRQAAEDMISEFKRKITLSAGGTGLSTDRLLNAIYLVKQTGHGGSAGDLIRRVLESTPQGKT